MALTIKVKSGLEAKRLAVIPAIGEILWTTDEKKLYVGDGTTGGGIAIGGSGDTVFLDNYTTPAGGTIVPTDSVNDALGKLEVGLANVPTGGGTTSVQSDWTEGNTGSGAFIVNKPTTITPTQVTKLAGIQDGAQVNVQADWNETTGDAHILNQPVGVIVEAGRNVAGGFAGLDSAAIPKIPMSVIPALPTGDVHAAADNAAMLALTGLVAGDVVIVEDTGELYFANPGINVVGPNALGDFTLMPHPGAGVTSVNGQVGVAVVDGSNLPVTGYAIATSDVAIDPTDQINDALGKLEFNVKKHSTFSGLDDTTVINPQIGQVVMYDGAGWENSNIIDGGAY